MLRKLNVLWLFIALATVLSTAGCGQTEFTLTNGEIKPMSDFQGRWLVVNYWAVWCKPCVEEIPQLNKLNEREDTVVLGVNFDGIQGDALIHQAETLGIQYAMIAHDPAENLDIKRPSVLPATVLIDPDSNIKHVLFGPQTVDSIVDKMQ
ncbi:TlpA family protein disulfide reductase [Alkalimarinus alittae]|uniref:TlpA family protein disulfide reductase n=1 Tax=Alkalimarinus alittae TaxID=2961619 RepID=A0ABY6N5Q9_9ALTE|nr:TlpA disulfide reductase family protein [Alkalimarinus alittae]UZE97344.1 TlpA family protein disulfide reductase [Alkalimarinus alittae]